jgi:hypothetical protein
VERLNSSSASTEKDSPITRDVWGRSSTNGSLPEGWPPTNGSGLPEGGWPPPLLLQPRCFSMCESADLLYRQGNSVASAGRFYGIKFQGLMFTFDKCKRVMLPIWLCT